VFEHALDRLANFSDAPLAGVVSNGDIEAQQNGFSSVAQDESRRTSAQNGTKAALNVDPNGIQSFAPTTPSHQKNSPIDPKHVQTQI
jgi:hypothetical protein